MVLLDDMTLSLPVAVDKTITIDLNNKTLSVNTLNLKNGGSVVNAIYYAATVRGHLTINTTDASVTSANIVDNTDGSHTINYIG